MAEWATPEREKKRGVEPRPIEAPIITPIRKPEPAPVETPERELVPARRRQS